LTITARRKGSVAELLTRPRVYGQAEIFTCDRVSQWLSEGDRHHSGGVEDPGRFPAATAVDHTGAGAGAGKTKAGLCTLSVSISRSGS
jgi:hypothetical protein